MALRCMEGFDCSSAAIVGGKMTQQTGTPGSWASNSMTSGGAYGFGGYSHYGNSPGCGVFVALDNQPTLIVCAHINRTTSAATLTLRDGATAQVNLTVNSSGYFQLANGSGTVLATGTAYVGDSAWHYMEFSCTIHNTAGASVLKVDGVQQWSLSSVNTRNTANNYANAMYYYEPGYGTYNIDNLVVMDATGSTFNAFQGEMRIAAVLPNAAGTYAQWTPLSSTNYSQVNQAPDDSDTTYVSSSTAGNIDSYNFTDLSFTSGTILAVNVTAVARKDDVAARTLSITARMSSTDYVGSNVGTTNSSYAPFCQTWPTNDPSGTPWTVSSFNAAEFGIKEVS